MLYLLSYFPLPPSDYSGVDGAPLIQDTLFSKNWIRTNIDTFTVYCLNLLTIWLKKQFAVRVFRWLMGFEPITCGTTNRRSTNWTIATVERRGIEPLWRRYQHRILTAIWPLKILGTDGFEPFLFKFYRLSYYQYKLLYAPIFIKKPLESIICT